MGNVASYPKTVSVPVPDELAAANSLHGHLAILDGPAPSPFTSSSTSAIAISVTPTTQPLPREATCRKDMIWSEAHGCECPPGTAFIPAHGCQTIRMALPGGRHRKVKLRSRQDAKTQDSNLQPRLDWEDQQDLDHLPTALEPLGPGVPIPPGYVCPHGGAYQEGTGCEEVCDGWGTKCHD